MTAVDLSEAGGRAVSELVKGMGAQARFLWADVSRLADVVQLVEMAASIYGWLDGAFNTAGIRNANICFGEMPEEQFERMLAINLTGAFLCMKYEIRAMERSGGGGGAIVNTSSSTTTSMLPNMANYAAAKYGILGLTQAAATDDGERGIRVSGILPVRRARTYSRRAQVAFPDWRSASYCHNRCRAFAKQSRGLLRRFGCFRTRWRCSLVSVFPWTTASASCRASGIGMAYRGPAERMTAHGRL